MLIHLNHQNKSNEKAKQELLKTNEAITKTMKESNEQLEQLREVSFLNKLCSSGIVLNASPDKLCSVYKQAETKLKVQLVSLGQQHSKTQEVLKEKENNLEKLQAQIKTSKGSFEEEIKKLKGQVAELQEVNVKKVRNIPPVAININCIFHMVK